MSKALDPLPVDGPIAPPRRNGELIFETPAEGRLFGLTVALLEAGRFEWSEFQSRLIDSIERHEAERGDVEYDYYGCWFEAFGSLAQAKGWVKPGALDALERELAARAPGHDHG